jgi:ribonuclease G
MTRELLINITPREARAAVLEMGVLQELYVERDSRRGIVGNIYRGQATRVLPGMQAAFVEIGLERTAFLHAADFPRVHSADVGGSTPPERDISSLVSQGDSILVQVQKDPLGSKGARLSTVISLPSRFLVYTPHSGGIGVSARITDEAERDRLRELVRTVAAAQGNAGGGYIVRTAATDAPMEALAADMTYLARLWEHVQRAAVAPVAR